MNDYTLDLVMFSIPYKMDCMQWKVLTAFHNCKSPWIVRSLRSAVSVREELSGSKVYYLYMVIFATTNACRV